MLTVLISIAIFAGTFLALAIGVLRGRHCLNCSCKAADRLMKRTKSRRSPDPLYDIQDHHHHH